MSIDVCFFPHKSQYVSTSKLCVSKAKNFQKLCQTYTLTGPTWGLQTCNLCFLLNMLKWRWFLRHPHFRVNFHTWLIDCKNAQANDLIKMLVAWKFQVQLECTRGQYKDRFNWEDNKPSYYQCNIFVSHDKFPFDQIAMAMITIMFINWRQHSYLMIPELLSNSIKTCMWVMCDIRVAVLPKKLNTMWVSRESVMAL